MCVCLSMIYRSTGLSFQDTHLQIAYESALMTIFFVLIISHICKERVEMTIQEMYH
jgi:hypothetical protein